MIGLDRKPDFVKQLGADEVIDAGSQRFEDVAGTVDVVLDLLGGEYVERSFAVVKPGGRFVTVAAMLPEGTGKDLDFAVIGTFTRPNAGQLTQLAEEIDAGRLKVFVNRTFPLEQTPTALYYKAPDGTPGKIVITVK